MPAQQSGCSMRNLILLAASLATAAPAMAQSGERAVAASASTSFSEGSLRCLTQAIYYEARSQSADGQRAVAQVVLNRTRDPSYPNSVCGVVFQGSERITGCQFSFTCDGSMNAGIDPYSWDRAQQVAMSALSGSVYRPVGLATHYHTTAIYPYWAPSLVQQTVIGAHVFYRRPNSSAERFSQVRVENGAEEMWSPPPRVQTAGASSGGRGRRARQPSLEVAVMEIPVVERPIRFRVERASASASPTRSVAPRRAAQVRSGPSTRLESGVRVTRG